MHAPGYVKTLEEQLDKMTRENTKLQETMIEMSNAHSQEIIAFMESAQAAAKQKRGTGWF